MNPSVASPTSLRPRHPGARPLVGGISLRPADARWGRRHRVRADRRRGRDHRRWRPDPARRTQAGRL